MTYAIGYFIYGINLKPKWGETNPYGEEISDLLDTETHVNGAYSGSGDMPRWVGIQITRFDECDDMTPTELSKLLREVQDVPQSTLDEFQSLKKKILEDESLSQGFRDYIDGIIPGVFLTWGSS